MSEYGGSNWSGSLHPSQSLSQTKKLTHSGDKSAGTGARASGASGAKVSLAGSPGSDSGHSGSGTSASGGAGGRHHSGRSVASYDARPDRKDSGWMPFPKTGQSAGSNASSGEGRQQQQQHGHAPAAGASVPVRPTLQKTGASSPFTSTHVPNSFTLSFSGRRSSREGEPTIGGVTSVPTSPNDGPIIRLAPPSDHGSSGANAPPAGHSSTSRGPGSIPHFPGPNDIREPVRSPSPASSYASSSQFKAPALPKPKLGGGAGGRPSLGKLPSMAKSSFSSASSGLVSPWHALAAASGAPTPSLDGPGRNSPMLGGPFEKLNLEGSWSGANLFGPPESAGPGQASGPPGSSPLRRGSLPAQTSAAPSASTPRRPSATVSMGGVGMTADMLEKYRAMAGRASATGSAGRHVATSDVGSVGASGTAGSGSGDAMDIDPPASGSVISATSSRSTGSGGSGGMKLTLPPALARRRGSVPAGNSGLAPPSVNRESSPLASSTSASVSPSSAVGSGSGGASVTGSAQSASRTGGASGYLQMLVPNDAPPVLSAPGTLILDLRPPSAYDATHMYSAYSVSVPSTLLRRPAFGLAKMAAMLSPPGQEAVGNWANMQNVVLIDGDSLSAGDGSILDGVARKFEKEGFGGTVWFVRGGQAALMGVPALKSKMVGNDMGGLDVPAQRQGSGSPGPMAFSLGGSASSSRAPSFKSNHGAPMAATPSVNMRSNPFDNSREGSTTERGGLSLRGLNFSDASSQVSGSSASSAAKSGTHSNSGSGSRSGTGSGSSANRKSRSAQAANPFFDNIRQNLELSHGGITERITLQLPSEAKRRAHELPTWMSELVLLSDKAAADRLAHQFYTVELNEQKRLQAIMDHHSRESGAMLQATRFGDNVGSGGQWKDQRYKDREEVNRLEGWAQGKWHDKGEGYYPFSITAGIERGAKNRYKNIWPYDFARVRLSHPADDESDYINASYVQPRGSSRRYIATQGPLDATYRDFWTLVWEQDVRVIVMLTKQYEGGMIKCGNYWQDEHYGPLHVLLDSQTGGEDAAHPSQVSGFDFGMARAADKPKSHESSANHESVNIRREFILSNDDDKHAGSRRVVQIQCVNWPDFDVPESPEVLLGVIKDVDQAVDEVVPPHRRGSVQGIKDKDGDRCEQSPVLVHCSAGVGRTGSFIVVDSIIDALHREFEAATSAGVEYEPQHDQPAHKMPSGAITAAALEDRSASFDGHSQHGAQSEASGRYGSGKRNVSFSVPPPLKSAVPSEGAAQATQATHAKQGQGASMADAHSSGSSSTTLIQSPSPRYASRQNTAERLGTQADSRAARHAARIVAEREEGDDGMDIDEPAGPTDTSAQYSSRNAEGQVEASPRQRSSFSNVNPKVPDPWSYRDQEGSVGDDQSETGSSAGGQSGSVGRRPSLASLGGSDRNSQEQLPTIIEYPAPVTKSDERHRTPSPLRDMDNPVLDVLEGIRVQRMSLVQSLRQFVFVHRAIVAYYLGLLDDAAEHDRKSSKESSAETTDPRASSQPLTAEASDSTLATQSTQSTHSSFDSVSTDPTSVSVGISEVSEDDSEGPHKRRASPTELSPERRVSDLAGAQKDVQPKSGGMGLQRRGSNKRIKQDKKVSREEFKMSPGPGGAPSEGGGGGMGVGGSQGDAGSSAFGSSY